MTTNFPYVLKVTFDKSVNNLCCFNQNVFFYFDAIQNAYIANHSYKKVHCMIQCVNCMILYMPRNFFMNTSTILRKKFY